MNELISINNEECKIEYTGIYSLLDELVRRIKDAKLVDTSIVNIYTDIYIKVYRELNKGDD